MQGRIFTRQSFRFSHRKARGGKYEVYTSAGGRTWGSRTMPYTGIVIFLFIIIHMANFHFVEKTEVFTISDFVTRILTNPAYTLLYLIGLSMLLLHISHGFWSLLQTLGISHPKYDEPLRIAAWAIAGIMGAVYILITLLMVVSRNQLL